MRPGVGLVSASSVVFGSHCLTYQSSVTRRSRIQHHLPRVEGEGRGLVNGEIEPQISDINEPHEDPCIQ